MKKQIIWKSEDGTGEENLSLQWSKDSIKATSRAVGGDTDLLTNWDVSYSVACDSEWRTRRFIVDEHITNRHLALYGDGKGHWKNENGEALESIAGCIDIDFRATPLSNTLPIRRTNLGVGESTAIEVAYINTPDLAISSVKQIYTRLSERTWKFEQPDADFRAIITVDGEGLVVEYPGLFHRL